MANCSNPACKKPVGCGCNLKGGLCAECAKKKNEAIKAPVIPDVKKS